MLEALHGTVLPQHGQAELLDLLTRSAFCILAILLFSTQLRMGSYFIHSFLYPLGNSVKITQVPKDSRGPAALAASGRGTGLADAPRPPASTAARDTSDRASGRGCECLILHIACAGITLQLAELLGNAVGSGPGADRQYRIKAPLRTQQASTRACRFGINLHA